MKMRATSAGFLRGVTSAFPRFQKTAGDRNSRFWIQGSNSAPGLHLRPGLHRHLDYPAHRELLKPRRPGLRLPFFLREKKLGGDTCRRWSAQDRRGRYLSLLALRDRTQIPVPAFGHSHRRQFGPSCGRCRRGRARPRYGRLPTVIQAPITAASRTLAVIRAQMVVPERLRPTALSLSDLGADTQSSSQEAERREDGSGHPSSYPPRVFRPREDSHRALRLAGGGKHRRAVSTMPNSA